ncbi:hypothetical protein [Chelativorans salis]|uniref:4,5-dihydroxyphthalate decarboxylase n=1 Tax=Chelativorans salis TaxID=2978478 RepID=A0ABT2LW90_9HYPH|nr:hypothetical protein [Chelativorans sp. EGI FJ00035]MCT7378147.1 hypothetical protein [Chelativorans sp. EGI FJ00035]
MSGQDLVLGGRSALSGAITQDILDGHDTGFRLVTLDPIHDAFTPMIREQAYPASELAIVAALQAVSFGKPLMLLPVTMAARYQHKCIIRNRHRPAFGPKDLPGKRVGVRTYSQTTAAWVRAILETEYGVPTRAMHWVTQIGSHAAEFADPNFVEVVGREHPLLDMLETGEIDAAIFGNDLPDVSWVAPVIDDPEAAGRRLHRDSGIVAINHVVALTREVAADAARVGRLMAAFRDVRDSLPSETASLFPLGLDEIRTSVEALLKSVENQGLVTRKLSIEDVFGEARTLLGDAG